MRLQMVTSRRIFSSDALSAGNCVEKKHISAGGQNIRKGTTTNLDLLDSIEIAVEFVLCLDDLTKTTFPKKFDFDKVRLVPRCHGRGARLPEKPSLFETGGQFTRCP
jgi:hypothetical protein